MAWNDETLNKARGPSRQALDLSRVGGALDAGRDAMDANLEQAEISSAVSMRGGSTRGPVEFEPTEFAINAQTGEIALPNGQIIKANAPTILQLATLETPDGTPIPRMSPETMEKLRQRGFRPQSQQQMRASVDSIPPESDFWGEFMAAGKSTMGLAAAAIDSMFGNDDPSNTWSDAQRNLENEQTVGQVKAGRARWYSSMASFLSGLGETGGNIGGNVAMALPLAGAGALAGGAGGGGVGAAPGTLLGLSLGVTGGASAFGEQATEFYDTALDTLKRMSPEQVELESPLYRQVVRDNPGISYDEALQEVAIQGARVAGSTAGLLGAAEGMIGGKLAGNFLARMGFSRSLLGRTADAVNKRAGIGWSAARAGGRAVAGGAGAAGEEMAESMLGQAAGAAYTGVGETDPMAYANADEGWAAALGGGIFGALGGRARRTATENKSSDLGGALTAEENMAASDLGAALTASPETNTTQALSIEPGPNRDLVPAYLRRQNQPPRDPRQMSPLAAPAPDERAQVAQRIQNVLAERFGPQWFDNIHEIAQDTRQGGRQLIGQLLAIEQDMRAPQEGLEAPAYERRQPVVPFNDVEAGQAPAGMQGELFGGRSLREPQAPAMQQLPSPEQDPAQDTLPLSSQVPVSYDTGERVPLNLRERRAAQEMRQQEMAELSETSPQALAQSPSRTIEQQIFDLEDKIAEIDDAIAQRREVTPSSRRLKPLRDERNKMVAELEALEAQWQEARLAEGPQGVDPAARVDAPEPLAAPSETTPDGRPMGVAPPPLENPIPMSAAEAASRGMRQQERRASQGEVAAAAASSERQVSPSTAEPIADLKAQVAAMLDPASDRDAVFVAEGQQAPSAPKGVRKVTRNGIGTLLTTNEKKAQEFRTKKLTDETLQRIIGYSENKADVVRRGEEPVVVQAQTPDGAVQAEQIATRRGAPAAAKAVAKLGTKGAKVVATSVAAAQARRAAQATQTPPKAAAAVATSKERSTPKKRPAKKSAKDDERTSGPSEAQIEAGNYQKRHETVGGLGIAVETEAGQKRRPEWPALKNAYGYIKRSEGKDGEHVDVFLGGRFADTSLPVFVVDQMVNGKFDEHKVMLGFRNQEEAARAYRSNYGADWDGLGSIAEMSFADFKQWVRDPDATQRRTRVSRKDADGTTVAEREASKPRAPQAQAAPAADTADTIGKAAARRGGEVRTGAEKAKLPSRLTTLTGAKGTNVDLRVESLDERARLAIGSMLDSATLTASDRAAVEAVRDAFDQMETMLDAAVTAAEDRLRARVLEETGSEVQVREAERKQLAIEQAAAAGQRGRPRTKPRTSLLAYLPLTVEETRGFLRAMRDEAKAEANSYQPATSVVRHMIGSLHPDYAKTLNDERAGRDMVRKVAALTNEQIDAYLPGTMHIIMDSTVPKQVMRGATEVAHAIQRAESDLSGSRVPVDFADHRIDGVEPKVMPYTTEHGNVPEQMSGLVDEWVKQFERGGNKFSAPVHVMSVQDAMVIEPRAFLGGRVPNGKFIRQTDAKGNTTSYIIAVNWSQYESMEAAVEVLAHEYGHMVTMEMYYRADPRTRAAVDRAFARWQAAQHGRSVDEILRDQMPGLERSTFAGGATNRAYATDFHEWMARNAALYILEPKRSTFGAIGKFFARVADVLRKVYATISGNAPDNTLADVLDRWIAGTLTIGRMPQAPSAFYDHDAFAPSGEDGTGTARALARSQTSGLRTLRDLLSGETTPAQIRETMDPITKSSAIDMLKRVGLSLMTMRQIERQYRDTPMGSALSGWVRNQQVKAQTAKAQMEEGGKWIEQANLLDAKVREVLEQVMYYSTHFGIHPERAIDAEGNKHLARGSAHVVAVNEKRYRYVRDMYEAMTRADANAAEIYAGLRDAFTDLHAKTLAKLKENIEQGNFQPETKAKVIARIEQSRRELAEGPYFPMMRFGDWRVTVNLPSYFIGVGGKEGADSFPTKTAAREELRNQRALNPGARLEIVPDDGGGYRVGVFQKGVYFYESQAAAEAARADIEREVREHYNARGVDFDAAQEAMKSLTDEGEQDLIISPAKPSNETRQESRAPSAEFVREVQSLIRDNKMDPEVAAVLEQLAIEALPENSYRQALLPRQNVFGASKQMLRSYAHRFQGAAHHYSVVDHGKAINSNWQAAWEAVNKGYAPGGRVLNVLAAAQKAAADRTKATRANTVMNTITDASSLYSLGFSPAYVMTNALQPAVVSIPVMAGQVNPRTGRSVGIPKATRYFADAYKGAMSFFSKRAMSDFINELQSLSGKRGTQKTLTETAHELLDRFSKNAAEKAMLESLLARGTLDFSWLNSLDDAMRGGAVGQKWANLQRLGMAFPQQVETMNRVVSALAAYRMAKDEHLTDGSEAALQEFADDFVADTQLDYSRMNRPLAFNKAGLNVLLQFKLYMQGIYMLFVRNIVSAFRGKTPEERKQGKRTVAYMLVTHAAAAGAAGLGPAAAIAKLALVVFAMGTPDDEDDWKSGEQLMREMLQDLFGEYGGTVAEKGLPAILGVDMSDRVGLPVLADSRFANIREGDNAGQQMDKWVIYGLGAPYSNAKRVVAGAAAAADGDFTNAAKGLPSAARAAVRSALWAKQGILDMDGDTLIGNDDLSWGDLTINALGLSPLATTRMYEERTELKQTAGRLVSARKDLLKRARMGEDVADEIREHNASVPKPFRISSEQIRQSKEAKGEREAGKLRRDEAAVKKMLD
jgi:transcriptional regulator with XRE-family HTH domain